MQSILLGSDWINVLKRKINWINVLMSTLPGETTLISYNSYTDQYYDPGLRQIIV